MIYLITNCTNAKKILPKNNLMLRNYSFKDIESSIFLWNNTLEKSNEKNYTPKNMYKGVAWQASISAKTNFLKKFKTKLLISSAGYGLINSDKEISSYAVTFSKGHEDSVHNFSTDNSSKIWWDNINKFDIENMENDSYIFISLPYEYLMAMKNTIDQLISKFGNKVFIINVSKNKLPESLHDNLLQFDTRFNSFQPGTLTSINQRCIKWLSNEIIEKDLVLNQKVLQDHISNFLSQQLNYKIEKRKQCSDEELSELISTHIKSDDIKSATVGLKKLRSLGFACEQKRYGKLFKEIKNRIING